MRYKAVTSFNTQPPEGGCTSSHQNIGTTVVSTHSRPKAAGSDVFGFLCRFLVSTHSRPKAAVSGARPYADDHARFNTQPPEGGCFSEVSRKKFLRCFNTQPPEGGCSGLKDLKGYIVVSTHSRPKAAAAKREE